MLAFNQNFVTQIFEQKKYLRKVIFNKMWPSSNQFIDECARKN